jgi:2-keto-4-pentenoate hydratase
MSTPAAEEVVAAELVAARREGRSLTRFPGVVPASMAEAYQIQELAMSRWQDSLVGWKIWLHPGGPAHGRGSGPPGRPNLASAISP